MPKKTFFKDDKVITTHAQAHDFITLFADDFARLGIDIGKIFPEAKGVKIKDFLTTLSAVKDFLGNLGTHQQNAIDVALKTIKNDLFPQTKLFSAANAALPYLQSTSSFTLVGGNNSAATRRESSPISQEEFWPDVIIPQDNEVETNCHYLFDLANTKNAFSKQESVNLFNVMRYEAGADLKEKSGIELSVLKDANEGENGREIITIKFGSLVFEKIQQDGKVDVVFYDKSEKTEVESVHIINVYDEAKRESLETKIIFNREAEFKNVVKKFVKYMEQKHDLGFEEKKQNRSNSIMSGGFYLRNAAYFVNDNLATFSEEREGNSGRRLFSEENQATLSFEKGRESDGSWEEVNLISVSEEDCVEDERSQSALREDERSQSAPPTKSPSHAKTQVGEFSSLDRGGRESC